MYKIKSLKIKRTIWVLNYGEVCNQLVHTPILIVTTEAVLPYSNLAIVLEHSASVFRALRPSNLTLKTHLQAPCPPSSPFATNAVSHRVSLEEPFCLYSFPRSYGTKGTVVETTTIRTKPLPSDLDGEQDVFLLREMKTLSRIGPRKAVYTVTAPVRRGCGCPVPDTHVPTTSSCWRLWKHVCKGKNAAWQWGVREELWDTALLVFQPLHYSQKLAFSFFFFFPFFKTSQKLNKKEWKWRNFTFRLSWNSKF